MGIDRKRINKNKFMVKKECDAVEKYKKHIALLNSWKESSFVNRFFELRIKEDFYKNGVEGISEVFLEEFRYLKMSIIEEQHISTLISFLSLTFASIYTILEIDKSSVLKDTNFDFNAYTEFMLNTFESKNHDYGNSFEKSLDEDGILVSKIRVGDKVNRFVQLSTNKGKVGDESIQDTLLDMANYSMMSVMWLYDNYESCRSVWKI